MRSIGADHVIDYTYEDIAGDERRYDLVLDIGGSRPLTSLRSALTPRGALVMIGGEGGGRLTGMDRQFRALAISPFVRHRLQVFIARQNGDDLEVLAQLIEAGKVTPVIDRTYPLAETADAMRHLAAGRARGKVVVTVR